MAMTEALLVYAMNSGCVIVWDLGYNTVLASVNMEERVGISSATRLVAGNQGTRILIVGGTGEAFVYFPLYDSVSCVLP